MRLSSARAAAATWSCAFQLFAAGCARMQPAPGGPPDHAPPQLMSVYPDSIAAFPGFNGEVEFRFDEVIAQGGPAGGAANELERLVIVSPSTRLPKVRWRRDRITVAPAEGWQPNRVYRIELLPGITDLRRNRSDTSVVVTFTTGAAMPATTLTGTVVDWTTRRPVPAALVVALLLPDSLRYRGITDSSGAFTLGPLPRGEYLVYGVIDQNRDHRQDTREAFDSARVPPGGTAAGELWAFVHDSAPPRLASATTGDSVSATVTFTQMLDPRQELGLSDVRLRHLPDSAAVTVTSLLSPAADDSLHHAPSPADTARRDTIPVPAPRTSRPALFDHMIVRVAEPWRPGDHYLLEIRGVRNVTGVTANVQGVIAVPKQLTPLDSLKQIRPPLQPRRP